MIIGGTACTGDSPSSPFHGNPERGCNQTMLTGMYLNPHNYISSLFYMDSNLTF